jgi:WhiB family transcriptional regulator, redox-sensing transcriptional regulator
MNELATRPHRAPDSGRFDADAAVLLGLIAQGSDPAARTHRARIDDQQAIGRRRYRFDRSTAAQVGDPLGRRAGADLPCQLHDPDLWFATAPAELERAKELCAGCPAQRACLIGALERNEHAGVWGGYIFDHGKIVTFKRPRGRPAKHARAPERYPA